MLSVTHSQSSRYHRNAHHATNGSDTYHSAQYCVFVDHESSGAAGAVEGVAHHDIAVLM